MSAMYKNQLQELAQRSCFNLPSYACIREGPDHAPRFKASVNFNGEIFEGPSYSTTLRQAEHAAAEVALNTLTTRGPSRCLTARVLDETGVYKNLLQETAHRAGLNLPVYTTVRSGPGHIPVFACSVELAGMNFTGEPAKTKKQAEKNAAMAAWSALKRMPNLGSSQSNRETESSEEQDRVVVARVLSNYRPKDENKLVRLRDQNQARRRMVLGYRDNSTGSSSHNSPQYQQWRYMNLLSNFSSVHPTQSQNQKHSSFLALLPPPPLPKASKILPPTSSRNNSPSLYSSNMPIPVQVRAESQVKIQEILPPLEEHQKDDEQCLNGKSDIIEKDPNNSNSSSAFRPKHYRSLLLPYTGRFNTPVPDHSTQQTQTRCRPFRPPTPFSTAIAPSRTMASEAIPLPKVLNTGGFYSHSIAPAVHIRSVIPVCAAPPMRPPSSNPPTSLMKEPLASSSASVSTQKGEEVSSAISMPSNLQL
ncbi:hypothetical protein HHK36_025225 [Tetracentron sinense]|uniref:DRBM domain-containing protein n=1 Tax=Tetracentron sinense TaxID=13715 RepID=A0A834YQH1_TETSI|nr:hypothetical protein HHK36_025225 [Tetracentron sinense]